jgi:hypothetical protein
MVYRFAGRATDVLGAMDYRCTEILEAPDKFVSRASEQKYIYHSSQRSCCRELQIAWESWDHRIGYFG